MPSISSHLCLFICLVISLMIFPQDSDARTFRIGIILSTTGIAAPHNEPLMEMIRLGVEDVNRREFFKNNPLQLIILNNESTPLGSKVAAEEAVRLNLTAVIGAHWSSHSMAIAPVLQAAGIPMISPGSTNPKITRIGNYIFRACFLDSFQGHAMAKFALNDLQVDTAAIIQNIDETYSTTLADYFKLSFEKNGGKVLVDDGYRGKATDFTQLLKKIAQASPQVIYLPGYTRDSGLFIKQARKMGIQSTFLGGDAWDEIDTFAHEALNGSFQTAPWHPQVPFKESEYLQKRYFQKFNEKISNMSAPLAFDAVLLLANAIERAGSNNRKKIRDALAETSHFQGATGLITFDENGDPKGKGVIVIQHINGKRVYNKTIQPY